MLRAGVVAVDEISHGLGAIHAAKAVRANRIATTLRWVVSATAGIPVRDAERIAARGHRRGVRLRERPVIGEALADRRRRRGRGAGERICRDPVLNDMPQLMQDDVAVLGVGRPSVAEEELTLPGDRATEVERVVIAPEGVRIAGHLVVDEATSTGIAKGEKVLLRAIELKVGVHLLELWLAAIEEQWLGSIGRRRHPVIPT